MVTLLCDINCMYCYKTFITVISEPGDVTVCEGKSTSFTCVLNNSVNSSAVQWYRLLKDTSTTEMVDPQDSNIDFTTSTTNNTLTTNLTITNAIKSHTGYYWVRLPSGDVCNVSLTVLTSMWISSKYIYICICIYSYVALLM